MLRRLLVAAVLPLLGSCLRFPHVPPASTVAPKPVPVKTAVSAAADTVPVWIVGTGVHSALVFEYHWLVESGYIPPAGLGKPEHVTMSWGDEVAYVKKSWLNPWELFNAFCLPSSSVMEIIPLPGDVALASTSGNSNKVWLGRVPRRNGPRLAAFLNSMGETGPDGTPVVIGPSSWGEGFMLKSPHSYYFPRICNVWSVQALEACGCGMNALTGLATAGVIRQAGSCGFKRVQPPRPPWEIPPHEASLRSPQTEADTTHR